MAFARARLIRALDASLIASLEDAMSKLIIVSVIATVIAANFVGRKLRGAASN
jgi:hypothetical protein